ncbi:dephospho-CoA kinase [Actinomycetaceae bacterium TAE3-ERU4]|nr:dephospho-CoA kinase [Actinomycetaceae bacterium TAE3-ERU4]
MFFRRTNLNAMSDFFSESDTPFVLGITGGIGSGKTQVSSALVSIPENLIDADKISRQITDEDESLKQEIASFFGSSLLSKGKIDRAALAKLVFVDKTALRTLEELLHPRIIQTIQTRIKKANHSELIVLDAPLLIEAGLLSLVSQVCVVTAPLELRLKRLETRGVIREDALARMAHQLNDSQRLEVATWEIKNRGLKTDTEKCAFKLRDFLLTNLGKN